MSDIREAAARVLCPHIYPHDPYDEAVDIVQEEARQLAGLCISTAEPHLRRKHRQELLDELIADSVGDNWCALTLSQDTGSFGGSQYMGTLADWLKSHGDAE